MDDAIPPLDEQLCFALYGASMAMTRAYRPVLDALGLTYPQYLVLNALWEEDGRTIRGLAARLFLESSTITPLVQRLEGAGLVTRRRDAVDERLVRVSLTPAGSAMRDRRPGVIAAVVARTGLDHAAITDLAARLAQLRDALASAPETGSAFRSD